MLCENVLYLQLGPATAVLPATVPLKMYASYGQDEEFAFTIH